MQTNKKPGTHNQVQIELHNLTVDLAFFHINAGQLAYPKGLLSFQLQHYLQASAAPEPTGHLAISCTTCATNHKFKQLKN